MSELARRPLGKTGVDVSVLGYGAMELRGAPHNNGRPVTPEEAATVLHAVLDSGITLIDTSPDYGGSEENIGRSIAHRRDEYVLASKCGCPLNAPPTAPRPLPHDYSRQSIVAAVENSLRLLRTDRLDLLQLHVTPSREVLERDDAIATMRSLQDAGKVRFIGTSSTLPHLVEHIDMGVFDAFQLPYSALQRENEALMTAIADGGAGVIVRGGVAQGEPSVGRGAEGTWANWARADLDELLDGQTRTQFMLRFTLAHPAMTSTIVGTLNPEHLAANVAVAARGPLPADVHAEAIRRLDSVSPRPNP